MSQHSFAIVNEAGASFRGDVNSALQALASCSRGTSAPGTTYAGQVWDDSTANVQKKRNAANSAWIAKMTLDETFVLSRASNTILGVSDVGKCIVATAGFTQTFTAAATLGDGWFVDYRIDGAVTVVFDPNSSENIDGATTKSVVGPAFGRIYCNGSAFFTEGLDAATLTAVQTLTNKTLSAGTLSGTTSVTGNLSVGSSSTIQVVSTNSAAGTAILTVQDNARDSVIFYCNADGTAYNAANAVIKTRQANLTGRSINAAGTVNASGADYAEYERKLAGCGPIAKGDIVGFNADGLITDRWALAVTFGVKSTNPSYIGGDVWGRPVDACPLDGKPIGEEPKLELPPAPEASSPDETAEAFAARRAEHEREVVAITEKFKPVHEAWAARLEAARRTVDRIAYAGKVPVNVRGAKPGQWIDAAPEVDGIKGIAIDRPGPFTVGRVRRILPDGRAEIVL